MQVVKKSQACDSKADIVPLETNGTTSDWSTSSTSIQAVAQADISAAPNTEAQQQQ